MTSIEKNLFCYWMNLICWKFQSHSVRNFELELVKVRKSDLQKKKLFSRHRAVAFKISHICCNQAKYIFFKTNTEKNGTFHMQIMIKGGNKHARIISDTCSKLSIRAQKQCHIFSVWTIVNNPCGVLIATF